MPTLQSFSGADAAAVSAYLATTDALLRLQTTTEELETQRDLCSD